MRARHVRHTDPWYPEIDLPAGSLHAGDQALLFRNGLQVGTFTYDGTPAINGDACAGASQFTGTASAGDLDAWAYTPANGSSGQHTVTITRTAAGFTGTLDTPLLAGDGLSVTLSSTTGDVHTFSYTQMIVAACPAATPPTQPTTSTTPVTPPVTGPTAAQLLAGVTGSLTKAAKTLTKLGIDNVLTGGGVTVPFTFLEPGTVRFVWLANAGGHAARAAKTTTVATGSLTRSTAGTGKVKVRLTKAGRKLLRRSRSLTLTIRGTFTPVGGKAQVASKRVTLKRHAKKKHHA